MTIYIIPTIWDYLTDVIQSAPFWAALGVICIITIGLTRVYRKRRGWY